MFFILIYHILSHYFPLVNKNPFGFSERVKNNFCVLLTDIKLRTLYTTLLHLLRRSPLSEGAFNASIQEGDTVLFGIYQFPHSMLIALKVERRSSTVSFAFSSSHLSIIAFPSCIITMRLPYSTA